mmetsp:Transcript_18895/g.49187  ORF Transcript_18895/g.49187 Transcript_18895/m.49187 type:complete len:552 (-) Transcript_18895:17-1672(-)
MRSISSAESRSRSFEMTMLFLRPVSLSCALTFRMPLASIEKDTSSSALPLGMGGIPVSSNSPSRLLSFVMSRSPSYTGNSTVCWLFSVVVNIDVLMHGIAVLRGTTVAITPPCISMPSESGTTSRSNMSSVVLDFSPESSDACTAAPYATASSGLIDLLSSLPSKKSCRSDWILGTRVEPPTSTTSSTCDLAIPASLRTFFTGSRQPLKRSSQSSSNLAREIFSSKSSPSIRASTSMVVDVTDESVRLARSHCERSRRVARADVRMSLPVFFCHRWHMAWSRRLSKSSPPRCVSPAVALTVKTPESIVRSETSKVPPPRSKMSTIRSPAAPALPLPFLLAFFSLRPYAMAAAVGSLMIRRTLSPAILPAFLVALRWASLKYAGQVMTAFFTVLPRYASAVVFISVRIIDEISSGKKVSLASPTSTWILGLPSTSTSSNGQLSLSRRTDGSSKRRPIRRLASKMVFFGFMADCVLAACPTRRSSSEKATYDGVVRAPWSFAMISTLSFWSTATHEYVVPRSMPMAPVNSVSGASPPAAASAIVLVSLDTWGK